MPELTLAHPERLWLLLLLPLLFLLLIPPRPRRVAHTAHLPQWREALRGLRRRRPRALSLRTLLLLLGAGAALAATFGVALAGRPGPTRLVVLLDGSLSMAAGGAFDAAVAAVRARGATLPPAVDVRLLRCGGPLLRRHGESARLVHDVGHPAGARAVDLRELAVAVGSQGTVVWTLTDGQGEGALPEVGALTLLGASAPNAAVLAVRLVDRWPLPELEVEADVIAFGDGELPVRVAIAGAVAAAAPVDLVLTAGEPRTAHWTLVREPAGGRLDVTATLTGDGLPADDHWSALLPPLPAPRIAVLAGPEAGPFAGVAAAALAEEVAGAVVDEPAGAEVGLLVVDGGRVELQPGSARALCFGTELGGTPAGAAAAAAAVEGVPVGAIDWRRDSPLCAGLDLAELRVDRAFPTTVPPGEPFLFGEIGGEPVPLAVLVQGANASSLHFGFRLADSNLPLLPAFPQLLRRAFVGSHGAAALPQVLTSAPPAGEQDLRRRGELAADRPLPDFGTAPVRLGPWLMLAGALLLALRLLVR